MKTLINLFLNSYVKNTLGEIEIFSEDFEINYSTLGKISGEDALNALKTDGNFAHRYNIVSNQIEYSDGINEIVILNAFHFFVTVVRNEYHPLILGGKYKFIINNGKINKICFDLEAEMGNTYYAKVNWKYKLFAETEKEARTVLLDEDKDKKHEIKDLVYRVMLIIDTLQKDYIETFTTKNCRVIVSNSTYPEQYGPEDINEGNSMNYFMDINKELESQNHHSFKIVSIEANEDKANIKLEMLEPTKMGYKHFDALSVYKPYFNDLWNIELVKIDGKWYVDKMSNKPISKFQMLTYDTLEI